MNIKKIFNNEIFYIISENADFLRYCKIKYNLNILNLNDVHVIPKNSIGFSFNEHSQNKFFELTSSVENIKHIFLALDVFDANFESAVYNLELMLNCDFYECIDYQKKAYDYIKTKNIVEYKDLNFDFKVEYQNIDKLINIKNLTPDSYFVLSVADFFEVFFAHPKMHEPCPFEFNGSLRIDGMIAALRPNADMIFHDMNYKVKSLISRINLSNFSKIFVKKNEIYSFIVDNVDIYNDIKELTGKREMLLTEFAIGLNKNINKNIDFSYNSQLNEGVEGIHVGLGDAVNGYHLDLISKGTKLL